MSATLTEIRKPCTRPSRRTTGANAVTFHGCFVKTLSLQEGTAVVLHAELLAAYNPVNFLANPSLFFTHLILPSTNIAVSKQCSFLSYSRSWRLPQVSPFPNDSEVHELLLLTSSSSSHRQPPLLMALRFAPRAVRLPPTPRSSLRASRSTASTGLMLPQTTILRTIPAGAHCAVSSSPSQPLDRAPAQRLPRRLYRHLAVSPVTVVNLHPERMIIRLLSTMSPLPRERIDKASTSARRCRAVHRWMPKSCPDCQSDSEWRQCTLLMPSESLDPSCLSFKRASQYSHVLVHSS